ncbi:MAG: hypothetical protein CL569_11380 [Alphaproteobacteria bacterium]|nr:hypothetical protein [Alphaproteobacteria bacterium]|tara:strand:- start:959 stop:1420 length:462 start_codon:yes stop_codon:yes gene_type:complete
MAQFRSIFTIEASPTRVWDVLTDFGRYTEWNPLFQSAEGSLTSSSRVRLTHKPPFGRSIKLRGRIVRLEPERELILRTGSALPGLYRSETGFRLEAAEGVVRLHHHESFGGLAMGIVAGANGIKMQEGCYALNLAIKRRSEDQCWKSWPRARG